MKKLLYLMTAVIATLTFSACSGNDDNPATPVSGRAVITINTAALYEELNITDLMPRWLDTGSLAILDSVLIYDQAGCLINKLGARTYAMQPVTIDTGDLPNGTYTLVVWQAGRSSDERIPWTLSGEERLSTVSLTTQFVGIGYMWAVGSATATVTVRGGSIQASLTPKSLGSIIELRVDNLTADKGYTRLSLVGANEQYVIGCRLDSSLPEESRWIMERQHNWEETVGSVTPDLTSDKFFTLTHGDGVRFDLYGDKPGEDAEWILGNEHNLATGGNTVFYFDMDRFYWQPLFFGTPEDFAAWKADRDAGITVLDPCIDWGAGIETVERHVRAKQWWDDGNGQLEWSDSWGLWHKYYFIACSFAEDYLFETEDGRNLRFAAGVCNDTTVPVEVFTQSLLKQGYVYEGKIVFPGMSPRDLFFSVDRKTEVQVFRLDDGRCEILYQPTDPDDFQYIIPRSDVR